MSKSELVKNQAEAADYSAVNAKQAKDDTDAAGNSAFEREVQLNLDKERLTYICDYCGKVNGISEPRCARCGKRRPRGEYIKAVSAVRNARKFREELLNRQSMEDEKIRQSFISMDAASYIPKDQDALTEQDKKKAAREAVLQVIAAEKFADEISKDGKAALDGDLQKIIAAEREEAIDYAAEQLLSERTAKERLAADQEPEKEEAKKQAARRAVMQIIAAEKAAQDELKKHKDALSKAALKRIEEERDLAAKEACAKFLAEKEGIEKSEGKIYAERDAVKRILEQKKAFSGGGYYPQDGYSQFFTQNSRIIQPLVVVPYVNPNQPLLQYRPNQVYRFVPNSYQQQQPKTESSQPAAPPQWAPVAETAPLQEQEIPEKKAKKTKKKKEVVVTGGKLGVRLTALFTALLVLGFMAALWFLPLLSPDVYTDNNANLSIIAAFGELLQDGINGIFGTDISILSSNSYVAFIRDLDFMGGIVLPFGLVIALVSYIVLFIKSIIRLITGKASSKGLFIAIFACVFIQLIVVGAYLVTNAAGMDFFKNIEYSLYAAEGLSLLMIVPAIICKKNK
ncbi:MAG: hypothetical protein ACOYEC_01735 [Christensenellales bacterium]|jgi:hypothetical protein|nr:hypothetical protein [Clostridiales bacterium]